MCCHVGVGLQHFAAECLEGDHRTVNTPQCSRVVVYSAMKTQRIFVVVVHRAYAFSLQYVAAAACRPRCTMRLLQLCEITQRETHCCNNCLLYCDLSVIGEQHAFFWSLSVLLALLSPTCLWRADPHLWLAILASCSKGRCTPSVPATTLKLLTGSWCCGRLVYIQCCPKVRFPIHLNGIYMCV